MLNACTRSVPPRGAFGGLPPSTSRFARLRSSEIRSLFASGIYPTRDSIDGQEELLPAKAFPVELGSGDLFIQWCGGGSGLADPLLRDPDRVSDDVKAGYVSVTQAEKAYGVMLEATTGAPDPVATERCRAAIRRERLGRGSHAGRRRDVAAKVLRPLSPSLEEFVEYGEIKIGCARCKTVICSAADDWRAIVPARESDLAEYLGALQIWVQSRAPEPLRFVERFCPSCATQLENAIVRPT